MRSFFFDGDFRRNPKTKLFCAICQRDIETPAGMVLLGDDVCEIINPSQALGNEYKVAVGPECLKNLPKDFILPAA